MKTFLLLISILSFAAFAQTVSAADAPKPDQVQILDTADALWTQIDTQRKALGDAVAANNKADVSRLGDALKTLAKAVESKYPDAPAAKKKSIHHEGKTVGRLCDDLNDAVAGNHPDLAGQILGRIDEVLKFLKETTAKK